MIASECWEDLLELERTFEVFLRFQLNEVGINLFTTNIEMAATDIYQNWMLKKEIRNVQVWSKNEELSEALLLGLAF